MYDLDFQNSLSEKIGVDINIIEDLFKKETKDVFRVAQTLIEVYGVSKADLGKIWGSYYGFAYVDPNTSIINQEYVEKVGITFILENKTMPLYKFGKAVTVTTSTPTNPFIQDKLEKKLGTLVSFVFCFPIDIELCIKKISLNIKP